MDVTDSGPDQLARKRKLASLIRCKANNIIYVSQPCLIHQYHLAVQDGMSFVNDAIQRFFDVSEKDGFRNYFCALAAIANSWRDQASRIINEWVRQYGPEKLSRQYPSQVIAGRWGSVDGAESFLLARGQEKVQSVLLRILSRFVKADKGKSKATGKGSDGTTEKNGMDVAEDQADQDHNPLVDDTQAYKIKLSKWYRTTFHAIASKMFWFLLHVCHRAREPLRHFFAFMQKHSSDQCLFTLVTSKIHAFKHDSLRLVLEMPHWLQAALDKSGCVTLSSDVQGKLKLLAAQLVFKQIRSLDLRILKRLDE